MVTKLHRHMGALIRENVLSSLPDKKAIRISPFWYSIGNMLPDISWLPLTHPHFAVRSQPYMSDMLDTTIRKHSRQNSDALFISPIFSLRLGIVCHYLCDFFCVAHQGEGINGARHHLNYEHEMRDFFYENRNEIEALCRFVPDHISPTVKTASTDMLLEEFRRWHDSYAEKQYRHISDFLYSKSVPEDRVEAFLTDIRTAIACCTSLIYTLALQNS
jgi:hypothetical protein